MTKRCFKLVATILNRCVSDESLRALLFCEFSEAFAKAYPAFDKAKWFQARKIG